MFTAHQKELLRKASSGLSGEDYSTLDASEREALSIRLEAAIKQIHAENPHAFVFRYEKDVKVDNVKDLLARNFYHAPLGTTKYDTAKKNQILWPELMKIKTGVK